MQAPRSLWPLLLVFSGALGLLGLGLYGLQGRIEGQRLREREGIRQALRVEAGLMRERALRASFWRGRRDVLRFTLGPGAAPALVPAPAAPGWTPVFGRDAGHALLHSWMLADTRDRRTSLMQQLGSRQDALALWIRARVLLKSGQAAASKAVVAAFAQARPPAGWEGPILRLMLELGEATPGWALAFLAGRSLDEILALPCAGDKACEDLRQQAYLRARARGFAHEVEALELRAQQLPLARSLKQGREILLAFAQAKSSVEGLLAQQSILRAALEASRRTQQSPGFQVLGELVAHDALRDRDELIPVLPGLSLQPRYPREDLGSTVQALYLIAGAILLVGILLATRALAKERRAFAQREDFLRSATHELKTPLASLRLLLESLVSGRISGEQKQAQYLQLMQGETERLSGLVGQALDFRRVEQGDIEVRCRRLQLAVFLAEMEKLYAPQLERVGRRLELHCCEAIEASCDPDLLRRILWNLLENARLHGGGKVSLHAASQASGHSLSLIVQDEGQGLEQRDWARVFEPFARGPGAGQGRVPGIGLGLAFVRRLARSMGGDCRILPAQQGFRIQVTLIQAGRQT